MIVAEKGDVAAFKDFTAAPAAPKAAPPPPPAAPAPSAPAAAPAPASVAQSAPSPPVAAGGHVAASPLARKLAAEKGIDIAVRAAVLFTVFLSLSLLSLSVCYKCVCVHVCCVVCVCLLPITYICALVSYDDLLCYIL